MPLSIAPDRIPDYELSVFNSGFQLRGSEMSTASMVTARKSAGIRLGWRDLTGQRTTWEAILSRLQRYSTAEALDYLTRTSAVLFNASIGSVEEQRYLCVALLGDEAPQIWRQAVEVILRRGPGSGPVVLFDQVSISIATKLVLRNLSSATTGAGTRALGEALLMLNDHIDTGPLVPLARKAHTNESLETWAYFAYVNGTFLHEDDDLHALARTFDIFLTDREDLRTRHNGYNLPALLESSTGLTVDQLWAMLFAVNAHFATITAENAGERTSALSRSGYFGKKFNFTRQEIDKFFAIVGKDVAVMSDCVQEYSIYDPKPFHVLPFEESPLVIVGDLGFAPHVWLLFRRLTEGIYHLLFNALPTEERTRFTRYVGFVFEDYIERVIERALFQAKRGGKPTPN